MARVLIYEGMNWHGECLASYYYYFKELGYEVDFVICTARAKEDPLWMIKDDNTHIYTINNPANTASINFNTHITELKKKIPNLFKYDLYFICTLVPGTFKFIDYLYRKNTDYKHKILHQNHRNYEQYLKWTKNNIMFGKNGFTLGLVDKHFPQLSPIKKIEGFEHKKLSNNFVKDSSLKIFISGLSHIHFKNFEKLVQSTEKLNSEGYNIELNVTGIREQKNYVLPNSSCINYLGRLNFEDMTKQYLCNDFLFVLFDEKAFYCLNDHKGFLTGRVSGSRNMSIMYKIPLVVQKPFQISWGLNDTNSISYLGHDYEQILLQLYQVNMNRYNEIIDNLSIKENDEFQKCLNNLKNKISSIKNNNYTKTLTPVKTHTIKLTPINRNKKPRFGSKKIKL